MEENILRKFLSELDERKRLNFHVTVACSSGSGQALPLCPIPSIVQLASLHCINQLFLIIRSALISDTVTVITGKLNSVL